MEVAALIAMGMWGWQQGNGLFRFVLAIGIPLVAAVIWGTFRVPNDPGKAPIAVPGFIRLVYEFLFFGFAIWALFNKNYITLGWIFLIIMVIHYIISYDRISWLLKNKGLIKK